MNAAGAAALLGGGTTMPRGGMWGGQELWAAGKSGTWAV